MEHFYVTAHFDGQETISIIFPKYGDAMDFAHASEKSSDFRYVVVTDDDGVEKYKKEI